MSDPVITTPSNPLPDEKIWQKIADQARILLPIIHDGLVAADPFLPPPLQIADAVLDALVGFAEARLAKDPAGMAQKLAELRIAVANGLPGLDASIAEFAAADAAAKALLEQDNPADPQATTAQAPTIGS